VLPFIRRLHDFSWSFLLLGFFLVVNFFDLWLVIVALLFVIIVVVGDLPFRVVFSV
jgi:hypothetical protein